MRDIKLSAPVWPLSRARSSSSLYLREQYRVIFGQHLTIARQTTHALPLEPGIVAPHRISHLAEGWRGVRRGALLLTSTESRKADPALPLALSFLGLGRSSWRGSA